MADTEKDLSENEKKPEIFISHPHAYKLYAEELASAIEDWSNKAVTVHQTSNVSRSPLNLGEAINPQLEEYLRRSDVVLLIYIDTKSAVYCM